MKYSSNQINAMVNNVKPDALAQSNWSPSNVSPSWVSPSICNEDLGPWCEDQWRNEDR